MPDTIEQSFMEEIPLKLTLRQGEFSGEDTCFTGSSSDGFAWAELSELPETALFYTEISWSEGTEAVGLIYVNDVALVSRCYEIASGSVGIFTEYGEIRAKGTRLLVQKY